MTDQFAMFLLGIDIMRIFLSFLAIIVFCKFQKSLQENMKISEIDSSLSEELLKGYQLQPLRRIHSTPSFTGNNFFSLRMSDLISMKES